MANATATTLESPAGAAATYSPLLSFGCLRCGKKLAYANRARLFLVGSDVELVVRAGDTLSLRCPVCRTHRVYKRPRNNAQQ